MGNRLNYIIFYEIRMIPFQAVVEDCHNNALAGIALTPRFSDPHCIWVFILRILEKYLFIWNNLKNNFFIIVRTLALTMYQSFDHMGSLNLCASLISFAFELNNSSSFESKLTKSRFLRDLGNCSWNHSILFKKISNKISNQKCCSKFTYRRFVF